MKNLKTIALFLGVAVVTTLGGSEEVPSVGPAPKKEIKRVREGEESKGFPICEWKEYDENTIFDFPEEKPMSKEDSIRSEELYRKEILEPQLQKYKPLVERNIKIVEEKVYLSEDEVVLYIQELIYALDLRALSVLSKVALHNPLCCNRVSAILAIAQIECYNKDTSFVFIIREALKDSSEPVQLQAARALIHLGKEDSSVIPILYRIAKGEGQENWRIKYDEHIGLIEYMSDEEIERCKRMVRNLLRDAAIMALGYLSAKKGNKECGKLIEELRQIPEVRRKFLRTLEQIRQKYGIRILPEYREKGG